MSKIDELEAQVKQLTALLAQHGIQASTEAIPPEKRPDYIPHGSEGHARLLGLVQVKEGDKTVCLATYTSPRTGRTFRLEDELAAVRFYPGIDPEKAVTLTLQQKVGELEIAPEVPAGAPPMHKPMAVYPAS